jgi:hypothetical protein
MTVYLVCFLAGLAFSALSLLSGLHGLTLFGHHFGLGHGHGPGHGPAHVHGSGHAQLPAHASSVGQTTSVPAGPSAEVQTSSASHLSSLNMAAITAFLAWFGGAGVVLSQTTHWLAGVIAGGSAAVGLIGGSIVNRFINVLRRDEQQLLVVPRVGLVGRVTMPIREAGTGEIVYTLGGTRHADGARSEDGTPFTKGSEVVIVRYEKGIAYVSTFEKLSAITRES